MGRWAARYAERLAIPPQGATVKTDERGVLSVLAVTYTGGADAFEAAAAVPVLHAAPALGEPPGLLQQAQAYHLDAVTWTDANITAFLDRQARLLRWGWTKAEAEALSDRLVTRDREADPRVSCTDCLHYRPGRCGNHRRAGLQAPDLSRDLAALLQRCAGFQPMEVPERGADS